MIKRLALLCCCALSLSGCAGKIDSLTKSDKPVATTYALHAAPAPEDATAQYSGVLIVARPTVPSGFTSERIALQLDKGRRMDYYAAAKWPDTLDEVLSDVIIESARNAYPGLTVDTPAVSVPGNYRLAVTFNNFQPIYAAAADTTPTLRVSATFTLISLPDEKILADFSLINASPALSNTQTAVTAGLEALLQEMLAKAFNRLQPILQHQTKS